MQKGLPTSLVDSLSAEKTALTQPSQTVAMVTQEKRMVLCEICGKFFVANEQSHILGKTHIGYVMIRDFLSEYKVAKKKAKEEERLQREKEANERRKRREKEDKRRSSRGDSSVRDKYQDRDRNGSRERTRDRERSQDRRGSGRDRDEKYYDYRSGRDEGRGRHYDREPYRGHDSSDWDKYQDRDENGSRERDRERSQDRSGRSRDEKYYDYRNGRGEGRGRHYDRES